MTRPGASAYRAMHQDRSVLNKKLTPGTLRRVVSFATPYRKELAVFLLLTIISSVIGVATPLLAGDVINVISGGTARSQRCFGWPRSSPGWPSSTPCCRWAPAGSPRGSARA